MSGRVDVDAFARTVRQTLNGYVMDRYTNDALPEGTRGRVDMKPFRAGVEALDALVGRVRELEAALRELVEASEAIAVYPEGAVGFEALDAAKTMARVALGGDA